MRKGWVRSAALLALVALALSACGGGKNETAVTPSTPRAPSPSPTGLSTCDGSPLADTGLPSDFPVPDAVTFVASSTLGPSQVVDGFATGDVESLYNEWKDMFDQMHYKILFSEVEAPNDAEISYEGPSTSGQVALRNDCGGGGRIAIHVVSRPE
jgi:hypothetical protein